MQFPLLKLLALSAWIEEGTASSTVKTTATTHAWQRRSTAPGSHALKLHIALRAKDNGAAVEQQLLAVSDPHSATFRQHLGPAEASELSTPAPESVLAVQQWLRGHGLLANASLLSGGIYEVDTHVAAAQRLLNATYFEYASGQKQTLVRTEEYWLPDDVAAHVDFVAPTTFFPRPATEHGKTKAKSELAARNVGTRTTCGTSNLTSPDCIRQIYGINYNAQPNRTTFAVYGTEAATFSAGDLSTFLSRYNSAAAQANPQFTVIGNGAPNETSGVGPTFETALDTQTLMGLAWPAQGWLYRNGGVFGPSPGQTYDPFVQFLQQLITNQTVPSVVSFSESNAEDEFDPAYARRLCQMMAQVGARGTTLLFSTGDNGPSVSSNSTIAFQPHFPASCPWVTAVGGTTNLANETAATQATMPLVDRVSYTATGGGFSALFSAPSYQSNATSRYISQQVPASYQAIAGFNPQGRGYPDVSAFSTSFPVVVDFLTVPVGGTSASTPLWAAVVALLNDYEAAQGRAPLGFLNPWLYSLSSGLKDITTGGNNAGSCGFSCGFASLPGYSVAAGWDGVTGLGSPVFGELTQALDALGQ